ncbi:hypothetical protein IMSAGC006_01717 [Muribaculaceae bacterium]|nr:hypothetical protein IMSAGC006_01717 [Muribaculaceae bacterium]
MCGNAVGLFAKYPVLGFLFGNHIVVKRTEHRGCCRRFCFLLFAEDAQEPLAFSLAGAFICALTDYERHFIGYTPIECPLTGMYIRQLPHLYFFACQYVTDAVYPDTFRTEHLAEDTQCTVNYHSLLMVLFCIALFPFRYGFSQQ